jgi:hypothetical protein
MPKLSVEVPHVLGRESAVERLRAALADALPSAGDKVADLRADWTTDGCAFQCRVMGMSLKGRVTVFHATARVEADLPFAAFPFMGKIETDARHRLGTILK